MTSTATQIEPNRTEILQQLERILADRRFVTSERNSRFLRYIVEKTLAGESGAIKEVVIATDLYGRAADYDPKIDSIVRVEASRLRTKLQSYYDEAGSGDAIRIVVPKGTYVPQFEQQAQQTPPVIAVEPVVPSNPPRSRNPLIVAGLCGFAMLGLLLGAKSERPPDDEAVQAWREGNDLLQQDPHSAVSDHGVPSILARAIERYEFAVAKSPGFAPGWASLAEAYDYAFSYVGRNRQADGERAEAAARRAVALDDHLPAAHAMLGLVLFCTRHDWNAAEKEYRRALELDPRQAFAVVEYADLLRVLGRTTEAETIVRKARQLLPALPVLAVKQAEIELDLNRPDAAMATAREAIRLKENYRRAHVALGAVYERMGEFGKALAEYQRALAIQGEDRQALAARGHLLGVMGRREEALAVARQLEAITRNVRNCSYQVAVVYAGVGESQRALEWLDRARQTRQMMLPFAAIDERLKGLRDDSRFQAIVAASALRTSRAPQAAD